MNHNKIIINICNCSVCNSNISDEKINILEKFLKKNNIEFDEVL